MSNHYSAANLRFPGDDARLDFTDLGRASFAALQEQIGAAPAGTPRPQPELIVRESAGPPPFLS